jgi:hypothetical protein
MSDVPVTFRPNASSSRTTEIGDGRSLERVDIDKSSRIPHELPFLVTHWLANYDGTTTPATSTSAITAAPSEAERQEAMTRIRRATSEIASAFATLGAFGTTMRVRFLCLPLATADDVVTLARWLTLLFISLVLAYPCIWIVFR